MQTTPSFSPLYQQIKALILRSLQAGEWKPAEAIPSEMELATRYSVSQGTVRKAVDELAAENLLMRRQGKGTFVATHSARHVQTRFLRLVSDQNNAETLEQAERVERTITTCNRQRATADIAKALKLKTGDSVVYIQRVLTYKNASGVSTPTILEDIWLAGNPFKGLNLERLAESKAPMYAMFEAEFGVNMVRADEQIRAVNPTQEQAALLQVKTDTPLLRVERIAYTYNDTPIEVRTGLYRTDTRHYRNELQ
ncbi:MAG: GntR family transcriptional regulator [Cytophagales bacterium]|nr:GntR family transcriptional regulator [Cytophagales bacterium]